MAKISKAEGFDVLLNQLRYIKYYMLSLFIVPVIVFMPSFAYFASQNDTIKTILSASFKYGLANFKILLLGGLIKIHNTPDYYYYQSIYHKYFGYLLKTNAFYYSTAISIASVILMFFIVRIFTKRLSENKIIRGTKVYMIGNIKDIKKQLKIKPLGHLMMIGATGVGKTQALLNLSRSAMDNIDKSKNIYLDTKGDFVTRFFSKGIDHIVNPLDNRSVEWSFMEDVTDISDIDTLAESFISPSQQATTLPKMRAFYLQPAFPPLL